MLLSAFWRLAIASSTSTSGEFSPLQCTDSSIALCMTVPRAMGGDHANGSDRWARNFRSHPSTWVSMYLLRNRLSSSNESAPMRSTSGSRRSSR